MYHEKGPLLDLLTAQIGILHILRIRFGINAFVFPMRHDLIPRNRLRVQGPATADRGVSRSFEWEAAVLFPFAYSTGDGH